MGVQEPEPAAGAPDWIVTFADMISLLVTFFILLMTFSSLDSYDAFRVKGNLVGTSGSLSSSGASSSVKPPKVDIIAAKDALRGAQLPHSRPASELLDQVSALGAADTDEHTEVDLAAMRDGLHIKYDERASFKPGSAELTPFLESSIRELANVVSHYPYTLVIEGHTDNGFRKTTEFPSEEALSIARAEAVAQAALAGGVLDPYQVQIAGHGSSAPIATNETPEGRRLNRRVEVRILSLSKERAAALAKRTESDG